MSRDSDFWSRRRAGVEAEAAEDDSKSAEADDAAAMAELEEQTDEEILATLNLPDPDTLKLGDPVSGFMSKAVPDRLRRRALRQLFRLNPVLANIDGLVEYGEDYTDAATVIENLQTTYQVGKGMMAHVKEMERQARLATDAEAAEDAEEPLDEDVADPPEALAMADDIDAPPEQLEPDAAPDTEPEAQAESVSAAALVGEDESEVYATPTPRRMQFSFQDSRS